MVDYISCAAWKLDFRCEEICLAVKTAAIKRLILRFEVMILRQTLWYGITWPSKINKGVTTYSLVLFVFNSRYDMRETDKDPFRLI